jgi:hypothetical protein
LAGGRGATPNLLGGGCHLCFFLLLSSFFFFLKKKSFIFFIFLLRWTRATILLADVAFMWRLTESIKNFNEI